MGQEKKLPFKILGVHHIAFAAKDPRKTKSFLGETLGLLKTAEERVEEQKVDTDIFLSRHLINQKGEDLPHLEVLTAFQAESSPISSFVEKKGGGIHHLALLVDDLEKAIAYLIAAGVEVIDKEPRLGAQDCLISFIHPRSTGGILVELVQEKS